jgi:tetratricopeptide (TPR) repeat protein
MADEAVALLRPLEDRRNLGIAFEVRGSLAASPGIGQVEEGIADLRMALTFLDPGAPYVVAAVQGLLGLVHERIHERKTAERWWQCCREQAASLNFSRMYALASIHLADLARRRREYEKATELIEAAMANSHGGADKIVYGDAKKVAGQLALDQGGYAAARDHLLEAYEIPAFAERWTYRLELEGLLGRAYLGLGERQAAAKHLANALEQAQRLELPEAALATLLVVAQWAAGSDAGGALALLDLVRAHAAAPRPLREAAEAQFDALAENASPSLRREALAEAKGAQLWESVAAWRERLER